MHKSMQDNFYESVLALVTTIQNDYGFFWLSLFPGSDTRTLRLVNSICVGHTLHELSFTLQHTAISRHLGTLENKFIQQALPFSSPYCL